LKLKKAGKGTEVPFPAIVLIPRNQRAKNR